MFKHPFPPPEPIRGHRIVVEAGAHIGAGDFEAGRNLSSTGKVIAIEPDPENFNLLLKNLKLSGQGNVSSVQAALSATDGERVLHYAQSTLRPSLASKRDQQPGKSVRVLSMRLDTLLGEMGEREVNVIIMNFEGAEVEALSGG